jgi:succinate dehydrogenase flavin-adding protein (antitoxin of CptAB toxin-antitoxin module)
MTPLEEFKKLVPNAEQLTEDQLITFRDLIDAQADNILDLFMAEKAKEQQICDDTIK